MEINKLITVGRNAKENDKITSEMSGKDYWFHVAGFPGAHVVMKPGGDKDLAINLAIKHSKAKGSLIKVTTAMGVDVVKIKGSPPGEVVCLESKEIIIKKY